MNNVASTAVNIVINQPTTDCDTTIARCRLGASNYAAGAGSLASPWVLCTQDQLNNTGSYPNGYYKLSSNIYFAHGDSNGDGVVNGFDTNYRSGAGWGNSATYTKNFDGQNFAIHDFFINRPAETTGGMFFAHIGRISNLRFLNPSVTALEGGTVCDMCFFLENVHVTGGTIVVNNIGGGLAGKLNTAGVNILNSSILASSFSGTISHSGTRNYMGGLAGSAMSHVIVDSWAAVTISGNLGVGGLLGGGIVDSVNMGTIANSYSTGTLTANGYVGGLVGLTSTEVTVDNSYSTANIVKGSSPNNFFGGLCGENCAINNSFFTGNITGWGAETGMLKAYNGTTTITNSYYLSTATCTNNSSCVAGQGTSGVASRFYSASALAPITSFDFLSSSADGTNDDLKSNAGALPTLWVGQTLSAQASYTIPFTGA